LFAFIAALIVYM